MYCLNSDFVHSHYLHEKIKMYFLHREISILEIQSRVSQVKKCMKKWYKSSTLKSIHACIALTEMNQSEMPWAALVSTVCNKCTYLYSPFHTLYMFLWDRIKFPCSNLEYGKALRDVLLPFGNVIEKRQEGLGSTKFCNSWLITWGISTWF